MRRVETLRQQAMLLRSLSKSFEEMPSIAEKATLLAKQCDDLADEAAREIDQRKTRPIAG